MSRILVVDDEKNICMIVSAMLEAEGHEVTAFYNAEDASEQLQLTSWDLLITDLALPGKSGLELLKETKEEFPKMEVVMMTAYATVKTAVEAMRLGAFNYLTKPFDNDEFVLTVNKALKMGDLSQQVDSLKDELRERHHFKTLMGDSTAWSAILTMLDRVASVDGPLLISGESGTGKEMVAKAVHFASPRAKQHFEALNCGALPFNLIESIFFGHKKGAFTGADKDHIGAFELCDKGTLFLDEVSELPMESQVKLLRVLQEGEITALGSDKTKKINVRVFSACNKDLEKEVAEGRFREDLFYRLSVLTVELPPLRERGQDVALLTDHFIQKFNEKENLNVLGLKKEVQQILQQYPWPGNVRELENTIYRIMVLAQGREVKKEDLPDRVKKNIGQSVLDLNAGSDLHSIVESNTHQLEKRLINERLEMFEGNKTKTAESLGVSRKTLFNKMKLYDIS